MPDLDESAQEKLIVSANTVFAAVKTEENGKKSVNIAVEGKFPFYTNFVLTDKNGWSKANKKEGNIKYTYYVHDTGFQLAIPTGNIAVLSSDSVLPMLQACENNVMNNIYGVDEVSKREALLTSNIDSAAFYSENPKAFIKSIIGVPSVFRCIGRVNPKSVLMCVFNSLPKGKYLYLLSFMIQVVIKSRLYYSCSWR